MKPTFVKVGFRFSVDVSPGTRVRMDRSKGPAIAQGEEEETGMHENPVLREEREASSGAVGVLAGDSEPKPGAWLERLARDDDDRDVHFVPELDDVMAQCPRCHTLETLQFAGSILAPCRRFSQRDGLVYHDCGSSLPCRLYGSTRVVGDLVDSRSSSRA